MPEVKVKMLTRFADALQSAGPGDVIYVEVHQARELFAGKYAEPACIAAKAVAAEVAGGNPAAARETATQVPSETRDKKDAPEDEKTPAAEGGKKKKVQPPSAE